MEMIVYAIVMEWERELLLSWKTDEESAEGREEVAMLPMRRYPRTTLIIYGP